MQLKTSFSLRLKMAAASFLLSNLVVLFCLTPVNALAADQNTAFIPFKINAPDPQELGQQIDSALQKELETKNLTMLSREEAAAIIDYAGSWPPEAENLQKIAEKTGFDYVAVGSLTQIADQLSLDIQVFDVLAPGSPHSSYRYGIPLIQLDSLISETVIDILSYTSRNFLIASIAPAGNERIDSGAILRKITTKPGD
ncbi:MAG: outer membrane protein assembly factor BamA, partial [Desulfobulbaceae bacterium]|nr:outer membrane protein assembly factor BamA [Desulfobulbaceae bacterium]